MQCRPAISSHSLGRPWLHGIESKLDAAARYGLDIELFHEDLVYLAKELPGGEDSPGTLIKAADQLRTLCDERHIGIVCIQPFMHYEGLRDRERHAERIEEFKLWLQLAHHLRTSIISIPSTFLTEDEVTTDYGTIVSDLREVADLAASEKIQIAYESLAWGIRSNTWETSWDIVKAVDRPNFGVCLDTFNIAARVYADPSATSQKNENADVEMRKSIERLISSLDVRKIVYIQVVDAEFLQEPLKPGHELYDPEHTDVRMSWSRGCRLFYGEKDRGAFLPIQQILQAVLGNLGFRGWVSAELFNRSMEESGPEVPNDHAKRAIESWKLIAKEFSLPFSGDEETTAASTNDFH